MKIDPRLKWFVETNLGDVLDENLVRTSPKLQAYLMTWSMTEFYDLADFDWIFDQVSQWCAMGYSYESLDPDGNKTTEYMKIDRSHQLRLIHEYAKQQLKS